jgi:hypothetical protein
MSEYGDRGPAGSDLQRGGTRDNLTDQGEPRRALTARTPVLHPLPNRELWTVEIQGVGMRDGKRIYDALEELLRDDRAVISTELTPPIETVPDDAKCPVCGLPIPTEQAAREHLSDALTLEATRPSLPGDE